MKTLLIITHVDFWRKGAGHRARIFSLVTFLIKYVKVTVVYLGLETNSDKSLLDLYFPNIDFHYLEKSEILTMRDYYDRFRSFIFSRKFDFAIIEYIELALFYNYISKETITFLDTHDLIHEKVNSFKSYNIPYPGISFSESEEFKIFSYFDYIITIQSNEYRKVNFRLGQKKTLLVPYAVDSKRRNIRKEIVNIGFVGSEYQPNVVSVNWFVTYVWPSVSDNNNSLVFNIYGRVCNRINPKIVESNHSINLHGFCNEVSVVYEESDILVNPVFFGGGLKIKNIEALGNGLPLITTTHGSSGLERGINSAFLVADTPSEFITAMNNLITEEDTRNQLCNNAFEFASDNFNEEICYKPLIEIIMNSRCVQH
jgi:glycosyltransferase involved in cell wall biosynthesis